MITGYYCPKCGTEWSEGINDGWSDNMIREKLCNKCKQEETNER